MSDRQKNIIGTIVVFIVIIFIVYILGSLGIKQYPLWVLVIILAAIAIPRYIRNKRKGLVDGIEISRLDLADRWKCDCGLYNSKDNKNCEGCGAQINDS